MLAFRMKKAMDKLTLEKSIGDKIDMDKWGPQGLETIQKLEGMRERMREATQSFGEKGAEECCDIFGRYNGLVHKAIIITQGISLESAKVSFKWVDAFDTNQSLGLSTWEYERAAILFNLAAALSFRATHEDRGTEIGVKAACKLFQEAAGVLAECRKFVTEASMKASPDLSLDTLATLETLMLAQAQKCFYEKGQRDGMKVGILAKIAAECAGLYDEVELKIAEAKGRARPIAAMTSDWLDVVTWNKLMFDGMQQYYLAKVHEEKHEYGYGLCRLTYAFNETAKAVNACGGAPEVLQTLFKNTHLLVIEEHTKAKKDNDLIYNEKVPPLATLPKPVRHSMVKPLVPTTLTEYIVDPVPKPETTTEAAAAPPASVEEVTNTMGSVDVSDPPPPSFEQAEMMGVEELIGMGFSRDAAVDALKKCDNSVNAAAELLLGNS